MPASVKWKRIRIPRPRSDRDLLLEFAAGGDPAAFAEVARRHGGLALRAAAEVCPAAADDVAQATLILLGRKAAAVAGRESAAGWVFETARRLALKARTAAARRAVREARSPAPSPPGDPLDALTLRELRAAVAEELARLPDDLRVPLVLRYWEGESQAVAAARLGCSLSTLKRRLDAGRDRLAARLARLGFAGPALLAALTAAQASGRVAPPAWVASLGEGSLRGGVTELLRPGGPLALFGKTAAVVAVLAVGLAFAGGGPAPPPAEQKPTAPPLHEMRVDRLGDPLPPGAVARLGSNRLHHGEEVERLTVSGDGRHVLSQGRSAWRFWEVETGKPLPVVGGKYAEKAILAAGPAGRGMAVVARTDSGWVLADALTGATLLNMPGVGGHDYGPAVRPDGKAVAYIHAWEDERTRNWWHGVKIWEAGKTEPTDLAGPVNRLGLTQLLYSPDSRRLAVQHSGDDGTQVWEPATGKRLLRVPNPENLVTQKYAFSPDGRRFYKELRTKQKIRCWDLETGAEQTAITFAEGICYGLAFSPDGKTVVISTSSPQVFWVLDAATGKPIRQVRTRGGSVTDAAWTPDGKRFITAERDDLVVRDAATADTAFDPQAHWCMPAGVFWSPDGKQVTTWSNFPVLQVRRWDAATGQPVALPPRSPAIPAEAADTGDKTRATIADKEGVVRAWDTVSGRELARVETKDAPVWWPATLTRDRKLVVAAGRTAIHVWDVDRARMLVTVPHTFKEALTVSVTAGGRRLVALGRESTAVWELPTGKLVRRLELGGRWLDVSADGRFLLTDSSQDGRVELWDLDTRGRPRVLTTKGGDNADAKHVMFARFAPDGRSVAVGFRGPEVLVVETATGGRRFTFDSGVETTGYGAGFSPDGRRLATAAGRSTLVWDVSGEDRGTLPASAEAAWADLKEPDAVKGLAAVRYLAARKDEAVRLLSERVPPVGRPDPEQIAAWVTRLAADEFAEREAAERALAGVADAARRPLEAALAETASPEVRRRLAAVLARDTGKPLTGERLRAERSVDVLERVGTPAARAVLAELAAGAAGAELTRAAAASLMRPAEGR